MDWGKSCSATTEKSRDLGLDILGEAWLDEEAEEQSRLSFPVVNTAGDLSLLFLLGKVRLA